MYSTSNNNVNNDIAIICKQNAAKKFTVKKNQHFYCNIFVSKCEHSRYGLSRLKRRRAEEWESAQKCGNASKMTQFHLNCAFFSWYHRIHIMLTLHMVCYNFSPSVFSLSLKISLCFNVYALSVFSFQWIKSTKYLSFSLTTQVYTFFISFSLL